MLPQVNPEGPGEGGIVRAVREEVPDGELTGERLVQGGFKHRFSKVLLGTVEILDGFVAIDPERVGKLLERRWGAGGRGAGYGGGARGVVSYLAKHKCAQLRVAGVVGAPCGGVCEVGRDPSRRRPGGTMLPVRQRRGLRRPRACRRAGA